ncbi:Hsp33 family molecular chaperone HslO [Bdellovibrionota bacterium FG-1]
MDSKWLKCISAHSNIRGVAIQATDLIQQMTQMHGLTGDSACRLGEAVMGALLLASYCKEGERINLNVRGSKRIRQALVDAHPDGTVRGYVIENQEIPSESLPGDDSGPWGEGVLSVLRTKTSEKQMPYIGTVPLVAGHLAKDLTFYWHQSEQIPSAVGLAVVLEDGKVKAAGGFLVQVLPGATPEEIKAVEEHIHEIHSLAEAVANHGEPNFLLSQIFQGGIFMLLEEKKLEFQCSCSSERVRRALALVGKEELQAILKEEGSTSVRCDFCTQEYQVSREQLEGMMI